MRIVIYATGPPAPQALVLPEEGASNYAADAGIELVIAKLIQADYRNPGGELVPLPERFDFDDDDMMDTIPIPGEYYLPSDLFPEVLPALRPDINGYEVRMTVQYTDWNGLPARSAPDWVIYRVVAYVFTEPAPTKFSQAKEKVIAVVQQVPYPVIEAISYSANVLYWERQ